ncbi:MAG TPA: ABC transporter permease, partial [Pyrinomonadaceae bacterium]
MKTFDLIKTANRNLFRNKLRTILTVLAIFVGSFTLTMTNGVGDGMRDYVESQIKNIDGEKVAMVRKKIEAPAGPTGGAAVEYKENEDSEEAAIDPNTVLLTEPQIDSVVRDIKGIVGVTPRYNVRGEHISIEGSKKYRLELGTLSEGLVAKTEAGESVNGPNQIVIPIGLARALDEKIENLVGKTATIGYRVPDGSIKTIPLTISGVMTKGFMTNNNSFVGTDVAK